MNTTDTDIVIRAHENDPRYLNAPITWCEGFKPGPEPPLNAYCGGQHWSPFLTFRTCSYCGCIHPVDLIEALKAGATLHGSDWKYGYPHKLYVHDIPNPYPDLPIVTGHRSHPDPAKRLEGTIRCDSPHPAGPTLRGKWYTKHLLDLQGTPLFTELRDLLMLGSMIYFDFDEGGHLYYRAPGRGFQM